MADFTGGFFWRVILAHLFGGFSRPVNQAGLKGKIKQKRRKVKCVLSRPVNCIMIIVYSQ
jgi:hypothetical protein